MSARRYLLHSSGMLYSRSSLAGLKPLHLNLRGKPCRASLLVCLFPMFNCSHYRPSPGSLQHCFIISILVLPFRSWRARPDRPGLPSLSHAYGAGRAAIPADAPCWPHRQSALFGSFHIWAAYWRPQKIIRSVRLQSSLAASSSIRFFSSWLKRKHIAVSLCL